MKINENITPYKHPDKAGNIFHPADRLLKTFPGKRAFMTEAFKFLNVPSACIDTDEQPRYLNCTINRTHSTEFDVLQDPRVIEILNHDRFTHLEDGLDQIEILRPDEYFRQYDPDLTEKEIQMKVDAKEYPADVGLAYRNREFIQKRLNCTNAVDDYSTAEGLVMSILLLARELYEREDAAGKHTVCTIDVFENMMYGLPDLDYLKVTYCIKDSFLKYIEFTLLDAGYTGYQINPFVLHGGKFTGKNEFEGKFTGKPVKTMKEIVRIIDVVTRKHYLENNASKADAGAGE